MITFRDKRDFTHRTWPESEQETKNIGGSGGQLAESAETASGPRLETEAQ